MSEPATITKEAREILLKARHKQRQDQLAVERLRERDERVEAKRLAKLGGRYKPKPGTLPEKLVQVAQTLPQPFTLTQLVIAAWKAWPADFCLQGEPSHVCSNKVIYCICGARGLVSKGLMERVGKNEYKIVEG